MVKVYLPPTAGGKTIAASTTVLGRSIVSTHSSRPIPPAAVAASAVAIAISGTTTAVSAAISSATESAGLFSEVPVAHGSTTTTARAHAATTTAASETTLACNSFKE